MNTLDNYVDIIMIFIVRYTFVHMIWEKKGQTCKWCCQRNTCRRRMYLYSVQEKAEMPSSGRESHGKEAQTFEWNYQLLNSFSFLLISPYKEIYFYQSITSISPWGKEFAEVHDHPAIEPEFLVPRLSTYPCIVDPGNTLHLQ